MDETRIIEAIMRQETTPREAREEVLSFLRNCSVEGDLDSLGLTELIYAMVVARQRLHGLLAERGEEQGEGGEHDAVAILGDSDEWCGRLTLTNRNKVGVNVKHYVARTEVEVLEKVVERVPHLSSEVSKQLRIFHRHVMDCVSLPNAEWMKRYLQWTDVLRIGKARIMKIRELLSRREKERISGPQLKSLNQQILCLQTLKEPSSLSLSRPVVFSSGGELYGGASTETKVKTKEEFI
uniref:Uncharacterized protein n=1 Tax=Chromera velia CCMP2878 TaxID=1169474 RepID=A0A0G4FRD8_9ALVE|eukprot:Cvel_18385.t1-p1 / transcript=Cvel_18385.t1 / gene=Cvel_18385 / organism=Chromera_velia_CCMP2878 / gene_product=hypothetical protein / transcript_product=hypothetical protein / location=Cvel_scaffold1520:3127-10216(+) / protein_length=237 / sequence_SO=supercontig / SO=protein_coding / is_pseudo=false